MAEVPALRRGVAILRHLSGSNRPVSAGALVRTLGLPRSTVYDLLGVLEELGMVYHADSGYVLGAGVQELSASYLRTNPLQRLAAPLVRALAEQTGATAQLAVLRGWETVYLLKEQAVESVAVITASGITMPGYLTATGRAIMAHLPKRDLLAILQAETTFVNRTGRGPRTYSQLSAELSLTRRRGWAEETGEVTPGVRTVAAPVFDVMERPIAALGVSVAMAEEEAPADGSGARASNAGGAGAAEATAPTGTAQIAAAVRRAAESLSAQLA
ncbi:MULTISPECIES: IclR family transcriptional regulator [Brevibacterium]|jgi:DNA-binding IclR family transcriptional regulator|uniref:IclR family transcriptional regulator n=1 Tax=Brevibacterium salitolerans TaxID=1403566 RepID=A0ABN2WT69_9MICO|nr:IclR family transcriptional regulator [Brevibacterium sp.]